MSPSGFFLLGFTAPLVSGGLAAFGGYLMREWLRDHGMHPFVAMFVLFILLAVAVRGLVHSMVAVRCPRCSHRSAYEMEGISCRFRCRVCGKDF